MPQTDKDKTIDEALKEINKKYGNDSIIRMDKDGMEKIKIDRVPTGSYLLDSVLGGGLPRGRIIELYGGESSGKSTLALFIVSQIQKNGGKAVWIDMEYCMDNDYSTNIGVNVNDLIISRPDTGEEALDTIDSMARSNAVDLIVVDSVSAMVPEKELAGEIIDEPMARMARMMSKGMRMIAGNISKSKTIVIFINQTRSKIGVFYGKKTTTPGGRALKFFSSIRLEVYKGKNIYVGDTKSEVLGNWMKISATKNKVAPPFRSCDIELIYKYGIDLEGDLLDYAIENKIIIKNGNTLEFGKVKLGVGREVGKKYLKEHEDVKNDIIKVINTKNKE